MAKLGYNLVGVDYHESFLTEARLKAHEAGVSADFIRGSMDEIVFSDTFDAVFNVFSGIGYFEDPIRDQEVIGRAAQALKPLGRLVLETIHRDRAVSGFSPKDWREADGRFLLEE